MGSRLRGGNGGGSFMALRIREDNGGGETMDSRPCLHGQALRGGNGGGGRMGSRLRGNNGGGGQVLRGGNGGGRRWVPASARTTEGREDGFPPLSSWAGSARGQRSGEGGGDGFPHPRGQRRWSEDGFPPPREQRRGGRALVQEGYGTGLYYQIDSFAFLKVQIG